MHLYNKTNSPIRAGQFTIAPGKSVQIGENVKSIIISKVGGIACKLNLLMLEKYHKSVGNLIVCENDIKLVSNSDMLVNLDEESPKFATYQDGIIRILDYAPFDESANLPKTKPDIDREAHKKRLIVVSTDTSKKYWYLLVLLFVFVAIIVIIIISMLALAKLAK
jgi:hypothetical protein